LSSRDAFLRDIHLPILSTCYFLEIKKYLRVFGPALILLCLLSRGPLNAQTATPTPTLGCDMVDNLEDGNLTNFFGGTWSGYGWGGGTFANPPAVVSPGANGTNDSVEETGSNSTTTGSDGFGILTTLSPTTGGSVNLAGTFQGLSFWVKASQAATLRVEIASSIDQADNNTDYYGFDFTVGTAFQEVTIPLSAFATIGYGTTGTLASELANAVQIQWQTQNSDYPGGMSFWVDEVCILANQTSTFTPTPTLTSTVTLTPTSSASKTPTQTVTPSVTNTPLATNTPTPSPSPISSPSPTGTFTPTPTSTNSPTPTPPVVSTLGCFAQTGDGGDIITSEGSIPAVAVQGYPGAGACSGAAWISDNVNAFSSQATPTTITFQRQFTLSSGLMGTNPCFTLNFGADDEAIFVATNSSFPGGVTVANCTTAPGSQACQFCNSTTFPGSDMAPGLNTLTVYLINTTSVQVGSSFGYTALNYQLCVVNCPTNTPTNSATGSPTGTLTNSPTPTVTGSPTNTATLSPTLTPSLTPTNTQTGTNTNTVTVTLTNSATGSPTNTVINTLTATPSNTSTNTPANTATPVPSFTPVKQPTPQPTIQVCGNPGKDGSVTLTGVVNT
jgi:hypothetical protein